MKRGRKSRDMTIREWVGPRCFRAGINRSTSDIIEATNNKGTFTLTFRSLDIAFPVKYPKARWPTANVYGPSQWLRRCAIDYLNYNLKQMIITYIG